jgi:hypothetical protein
MGVFLFWMFLPYLIAAFVAIARRTSALEGKSPLDIGRNVTKIARETFAPAKKEKSS